MLPTPEALSGKRGPKFVLKATIAKRSDFIFESVLCRCGSKTGRALGRLLCVRGTFRSFFDKKAVVHLCRRCSEACGSKVTEFQGAWKVVLRALLAPTRLHAPELSSVGAGSCSETQL